MIQQTNLDLSVLAHAHVRLNNHPLYAAIQTREDLRFFMKYHVYPVWDFMSLLKYLQNHIAPAHVPWAPVGSSSVRYFINQIVLGEESDEGLPDSTGRPTYASHFELYCDAMREIGADPSDVLQFSRVATQQGIEAGFALGIVPEAAQHFMASTFSFLATGEAHIVASAFAFGREHIIPEMFRSLLAKMGITEQDAPIFHYYMKRHIHLDEDFHAPMALKMVNELIGGSAEKSREAERAAHTAIEARLALWDGVLTAMHQRS